MKNYFGASILEISLMQEIEKFMLNLPPEKNSLQHKIVKKNMAISAVSIGIQGAGNKAND